jgi:hypothetical protein
MAPPKVSGGSAHTALGASPPESEFRTPPAPSRRRGSTGDIGPATRSLGLERRLSLNGHPPQNRAPLRVPARHPAAPSQAAASGSNSSQEGAAASGSSSSLEELFDGWDAANEDFAGGLGRPQVEEPQVEDVQVLPPPGDVAVAAESSPPPQSVTPSAQRVAPPELPQVSDRHLNRMSTWVERAIEQSHGQPLSEPTRQGVRQRMEMALRLLSATGMREADVEAWATRNHKKAFWASVCTGVLEQSGYLTGMETALNAISAPERANVGSIFGAYLGGYVGLLDTATTIAADKIDGALVKLGSADSMPEGVALRDKWGAIVHNAAWKTIDNTVKNSVRILIPVVQQFVEQRFLGKTDGLIDKFWCDELDIGWDGAAGLANGVIGKLRKLREDGSGVPYLAKLFLQPPEDLAVQIGLDPAALPVGARSEPAEGERAVVRAQTARNVAKELAIPMAVVGIIVAHVSMLISRNSNIITDGHQDRDPNLANLKALERVDPNVMVQRAISSTHQMALMTFVIGMLAPVFEMAVDKVIDFAVDPRMPDIRLPLNLRPSLPEVPDEEP